MVLLRKTCLFNLVRHKEVTPNCLAVRLKSASNQKLEIAFVYNPNEETEKIKNLKNTVSHLADNGCSNQLIIGDYNLSMNRDLEFVGISRTRIRYQENLSLDYRMRMSTLMSTDSSTPMIKAKHGKCISPTKGPESIMLLQTRIW